MKKATATKKPSVTNLRREIKLDESQFEIYQTGKIDIVSPTGISLDVIGNQTAKLNKFGDHEEVANNLCLVSELLLGNQNGAELSPHSIAALTDLLSRAEGLIAR